MIRTLSIRPSLTLRPRGASARAFAHRRRGTTAVLAMLYLVIFSTLAVGFYSTVTTATQIAANDERAMNAQVAAESGMQFMKYQLTKVRIPGTTPNNKVQEELFKALALHKELKSDSPNMDGQPIAAAGDAIFVPNQAKGHYIPLDGGGAGFRATVIDVGDGSVLVKAVGRYRGAVIVRAVELGFVSVPLSSNIFDYGIVTRGPIDMRGNPSITGPDNPRHADVMSTYLNPTQTTMSGRAAIGGELHLVDPNAQVDLSNSASIGGTSNTTLRDSSIKRGVDEPEFPTVDTSIFLKYATNPYRSGQKTYVNTIVPANANPSFSGGTIEGVLYIRQPNKVSFSGQTTIRGVIVTETRATYDVGNSIGFSGGVTQYGIETLPANDPRFPADLRALQGSAILAPGFAVSLTGNSSSISGTMVADSFSFGGTSGATIDGTIIALSNKPFEMHGTADIKRRPGKGGIPAGLYFPKTFAPVADTYLEVRAAGKADETAPAVASLPGEQRRPVQVVSEWPQQPQAPAVFESTSEGRWATTGTR